MLSSRASQKNLSSLIDFETLTPHIPELHKKQAVTAQSLRKVEEGLIRSLP
jgi:hypothetical protein